MSFGRSFAESLQKGLCSLETGLNGLNKPKKNNKESLYNIEENLLIQSPERILYVAEALSRNFSINKISSLTGYDKWFIEQIDHIIKLENNLIKKKMPLNIANYYKLKNIGFSDNRISELSEIKISEINKFKKDNKITPLFKRIDTCAGEFDSPTPYLYSTYNISSNTKNMCEAKPTKNNKVIINLLI